MHDLQTGNIVRKGVKTTDSANFLGFDCANPQTWPDNALPTGYADSHAEFGADTPFSLLEFQGGSFDPWGGWGFAQCQELVNYEFERVFCELFWDPERCLGGPCADFPD